MSSVFLEYILLFLLFLVVDVEEVLHRLLFDFDLGDLSPGLDQILEGLDV